MASAPFLPYVVFPLLICACTQGARLVDADRVQTNVRNLAEQEKSLLRGVHTEGFAEIPPFPPGDPWVHPVRHEVRPWLPVKARVDGRLAEQYSVTVDPVGVNCRCMGFLKVLPNAALADGGTLCEKCRMWARVSALAPFTDGSVRRIGIALSWDKDTGAVTESEMLRETVYRTR